MYDDDTVVVLSFYLFLLKTETKTTHDATGMFAELMFHLIIALFASYT